ncbi:MAG TPA: MaoC family dehydratase [Polyangia bacterium]|nr:MaoC family dehydratase [Polyangia bacterium]
MNQYRWDDLRVGLRHEFSAAIDDQMMNVFAALSGDRNPLHVDAAYAGAAGFRGPVVFGLLTSSFYSQLVGMHLPGKFALLHGLDVDFVAPVFVGDRLTVSGEVTFLTEAYRRVELKARIVNQNGKAISKAKIRVGLHGA